MDHFELRRSKSIYIGQINTSERELKDLLKAWIAISIAFSIVMMRFPSLQEVSLYQTFIISAITVGLGFLLHELGHKFVAQRYGCFAEFRSFDQMLLLALGMSLFGFVFAAPGAVMITGRITTKKNGIISIAGPIVNLILAVFFLLIVFLDMGAFLTTLGMFGFMINSWLALFNMIPVWNFDGAKIWRWNKTAYGVVVGIAILFMIFQNVLVL